MRPNRKKLHSNTARPGRSEQSVLSFWSNRSSFLIGELFLGNLSETHDRPGFFVGHLIGNRASLLCTKAPMLRVPAGLMREQSASAHHSFAGTVRK